MEFTEIIDRLKVILSDFRVYSEYEDEIRNDKTGDILVIGFKELRASDENAEDKVILKLSVLSKMPVTAAKVLKAYENAVNKIASSDLDAEGFRAVKLFYNYDLLRLQYETEFTVNYGNSSKLEISLGNDLDIIADSFSLSGGREIIKVPMLYRTGYADKGQKNLEAVISGRIYKKAEEAEALLRMMNENKTELTFVIRNTDIPTMIISDYIVTGNERDVCRVKLTLTNGYEKEE